MPKTGFSPDPGVDPETQCSLFLSHPAIGSGTATVSFPLVSKHTNQWQQMSGDTLNTRSMKLLDSSPLWGPGWPGGKEWSDCRGTVVQFGHCLNIPGWSSVPTSLPKLCPLVRAPSPGSPLSSYQDVVSLPGRGPQAPCLLQGGHFVLLVHAEGAFSQLCKTHTPSSCSESGLGLSETASWERSIWDNSEGRKEEGFLERKPGNAQTYSGQEGTRWGNALSALPVSPQSLCHCVLSTVDPLSCFAHGNATRWKCWGISTLWSCPQPMTDRRCWKILSFLARHWWLTPVILPTLEAENCGSKPDPGK
jgi:hypothetical protein